MYDSDTNDSKRTATEATTNADYLDQRYQLAGKLRSLATEVERLGRQAGTDDVTVRVINGKAEITARYELEDPPEVRTDGGLINRARDAVSKAGTPNTELDIDTLTGLLSSSRRRRVVRILCEQTSSTGVGGELEIGDLAESIACRENDCSSAELTSQQRKRVYVGLYQAHLPKLDAENVIRFDDEAGAVTTSQHTRDVGAVLEAIAEMTGGDER